jgi:hypothetical protein
VADTLIPLLASRGSSRDVLRPVWGEASPATFIPLLVTSHQNVLAAIYSHPDIEAVWWLSVEHDDAESFDFAAWVGAAMDAWH